MNINLEAERKKIEMELVKKCNELNFLSKKIETPQTQKDNRNRLLRLLISNKNVVAELKSNSESNLKNVSDKKLENAVESFLSKETDDSYEDTKLQIEKINIEIEELKKKKQLLSMSNLSGVLQQAN